VVWESLEEGHLLSNRVHADLPPICTVAAPLGSCDAFLSHSWSDDGHAKWRALHSWAERFSSAYGRAPSLWLDKACIDQSDIGRSLAVLPIFLAGCENLLIVAGPTYTQRLWCVIEVFTFLKACVASGRTIDHCVVIPISAAATSSVQHAALMKLVVSRFATFDAAQARCFDPADQQRLLGVVESSYGQLSEFNMAFRRALAPKLEPEALSASCEPPSLAQIHWRSHSASSAKTRIQSIEDTGGERENTGTILL